ncbi:MAG: UDP-N-acetylmuramoyl-tripeptide--D-alanyl-D-alanine ligase [Eubacteriales bacterium]|nr:UDP-N-acetylmuramoyl-tripeptide--D-alanyl-D-alanine ligase [Eubacteriales bacterium]
MRFELPYPILITELEQLSSRENINLFKSGKSYEADTGFSFISLDSRECRRGDLFFCLSGKTEHKEDAERRGAFCIGGCDELLLLANHVRNTVNPITVAITGSAGKTTTKDYVYSVLSERYRVHKSQGNHNNQIGVPISILSMKKDTEYLILELGTNHPGEMEILSKCCEPNIALITNIGTSHIGNFITKENIAREKLSIISHAKKDYTLIMNGDDRYLFSAKNRTSGKYISVYNNSSEYKINIIEENTDSSVFELNGLRFFTAYPGIHIVYAAAMAYAVGETAGMSYKEIKQGMLKYRQPSMRQNIYDLSGYTIMEDCYNSSYESVLCALKILRTHKLKKAKRTVAVLGDILELGEKSREIHSLIGKECALSNIDLLIAFGSFSKTIAAGAKKAGMAKESIIQLETCDHKEVADAVLSNIKYGDFILFKASRKMKCEKIVELIKETLT